MKNKKIILWIALIIMAIVPVYAQQYNSENDFKFDWDPNVKNGIIITEYIGSKKEVSIPPTIQNNPVTGIGGEAFDSNKNITKVIIPNGVKTIMDGEFDKYNKLGAFCRCTNLTSVTIPNSVTNIGDNAFFYCTSLKNVTIPNNVTSIGKDAFSKSGITSITIPDSVTFINNSFSECEFLTSVTIGNRVKVIGADAFSRSGITSITIPDNVIEIEQNAFIYCTSLASVTIGKGVTTIRASSFVGCEKLISVTFQGKISDFWDSFPGDLRSKYLANDGGSGTYKRLAGGEVWKKQ